MKDGGKKINNKKKKREILFNRIKSQVEILNKMRI